jgi:hypothetical protein
VFAATVVGLAQPFVGEEKILARMRARLPVRRPKRRRWTHLRERALSSVAERTTQHLRGIGRSPEPAPSSSARLRPSPTRATRTSAPRSTGSLRRCRASP